MVDRVFMLAGVTLRLTNSRLNLPIGRNIEIDPNPFLPGQLTKFSRTRIRIRVRIQGKIQGKIQCKFHACE